MLKIGCVLKVRFITTERTLKPPSLLFNGIIEPLSPSITEWLFCSIAGPLPFSSSFQRKPWSVRGLCGCEADIKRCFGTAIH
jgi:hypothetical protein